MGKSIRSKVKRAYRAQKRNILAPVFAEKERAQIASLHKLAGFKQTGAPLKKEAALARAAPNPRGSDTVTHGGCVTLTNFTPTPEPPRLNVVHGPLVGRKEDQEQTKQQLLDEVQADDELPVLQHKQILEVAPPKYHQHGGDEDMGVASRPIGKTYKGKRKLKRGQVPFRSRSTRHPGNNRRSLFW